MLSESPNLSETVLRTLAEEDVLPTPILLEVLTANPQSTRDDGFLDFLMNDIPHPLAEYMIDVIKASWTSTSYRKTLEMQIAETSDLRTKLCNIVIQNMLKDTVHTDYDSVGVWINKLQTLPSRYYLIEYYVSKNDYTTAQSILEDIPNTYELSTKQQNEYDAYSAFLNFKAQLFADTIEINQLDSTRIAQLDSIAQAFPKTLGGVRASNALCFFYNICTSFYSEADTSSGLRPAVKTKSIPVEKSVVVYPNPAKDFMICKYNFANRSEAIELLITDITGKQIYKAPLKGSVGQHIWDTRNIINGNYIYVVIANTGEKYTGKIAIQRQ